MVFSKNFEVKTSMVAVIRRKTIETLIIIMQIHNIKNINWLIGPANAMTID